MNTLPEEEQRQLERFIAEGKPAHEIAFLMRLSLKFVEEEVERVRGRKGQVANARQ